MRARTTYAPDVLHAEALAFIRANCAMPFFLFVATTIPHAGMLAPDDEILARFKGKFPKSRLRARPTGGRGQLRTARRARRPCTAGDAQRDVCGDGHAVESDPVLRRARKPAQFELFNLDTDLAEARNVAAEQPLVAERLRRYLAEAHRFNPRFPLPCDK